MAVTRGEEHGEVRTEDVGQIPDVVRQEEEFVEGGRVGGELSRPGGWGAGGGGGARRSASGGVRLLRDLASVV